MRSLRVRVCVFGRGLTESRQSWLKGGGGEMRRGGDEADCQDSGGWGGGGRSERKCVRRQAGLFIILQALFCVEDY